MIGTVLFGHKKGSLRITLLRIVCYVFVVRMMNLYFQSFTIFLVVLFFLGRTSHADTMLMHFPDNLEQDCYTHALKEDLQTP